ncbi:putative sulfurtransferase DsrE [archaeon BMS3Bbin15]|nr:putative sulfurtransferase DsrE [archaeon BMS3Bbin15]
MATINILLTEGPFQTEKWETAANIAKAALEKGHAATFFMYMDGVHNGVKTQKFQEWETLPVDRYKELVKLGAKIVCCGICVNARGHQDGKYFFEGAKVGGIPDWATFVGEADRVITL